MTIFTFFSVATTESAWCSGGVLCLMTKKYLVRDKPPPQPDSLQLSYLNEDQPK